MILISRIYQSPKEGASFLEKGGDFFIKPARFAGHMLVQVKNPSEGSLIYRIGKVCLAAIIMLSTALLLVPGTLIKLLGLLVTNYSNKSGEAPRDPVEPLSDPVEPLSDPDEVPSETLRSPFFQTKDLIDIDGSSEVEVLERMNRAKLRAQSQQNQQKETVLQDVSISKNYFTKDYEGLVEELVIEGVSLGVAETRGNRSIKVEDHYIATTVNNKPFAAILDGHSLKGDGDYAEGKVIAQFVAEVLPKHLESELKAEKDQTIATALMRAHLRTEEEWERRYTDYTNNNVDFGELRIKSSGTTVTSAFFADDGVYFSQLGDSRAMLFKTSSGEVTQLTADQSLSDDDERGKVQVRGGKIAENFSMDKKDEVITKYGVESAFRFSDEERFFPSKGVSRAIGDLEIVNEKGERVISAVPEVTYISKSDLNKGDKVIIACDGVWDVLGVEDVGNIVKQKSNEMTDKELAQCIVSVAVKKGSQDHVSAMVLTIN